MYQPLHNLERDSEQCDGSDDDSAPLQPHLLLARIHHCLSATQYSVQLAKHTPTVVYIKLDGGRQAVRQGMSEEGWGWEGARGGWEQAMV